MGSPWQGGRGPPNARSATLPGRPKACKSICILLTEFVSRSMVVMCERLNSMLSMCAVRLADLCLWASKRLMNFLSAKLNSLKNSVFLLTAFVWTFLHGMWCGGFRYVFYYLSFLTVDTYLEKKCTNLHVWDYSSFGHVWFFFFPLAAWIDPFPNAVPVWVLVCWANCLKNCTNCKLTLALTSGLELLARNEMCWVTWNTNAMQTMGNPWETTRRLFVPFSLF